MIVWKLVCWSASCFVQVVVEGPQIAEKHVHVGFDIQSDSIWLCAVKMSRNDRRWPWSKVHWFDR